MTEPATPTRLNIGVIGLGLRGPLARVAHRPDDNVHVVALADISAAACDAYRGDFGAGLSCYEDYHQLLARDDIHAVLVLTPDHMHEEHALAALAAGKAVYLEKPLATSVAGCDRILRAAAAPGAKLYAGHNMRHMHFIYKMKELIEGGAIGEVKTGWCRHFVSYGGDAFYKDWHAVRSNAVGLLLQKACHDIDVLHWLCGGYTTRVNAFGGLLVYNQVTDRRHPDEPPRNMFNPDNWPPLAQRGLHPDLDVEDVNMFQGVLDNGVLIAYQQCHFTPDAWRNYTIIGTAGRLENIGEDLIRVWNRRRDGHWDGDEDHAAPPVPGSHGHGGSDERIIGEFIRYVRDGCPTTTSPVAARQAVATAIAATESVRNGNVPVDITPLPDEVRG